MNRLTLYRKLADFHTKCGVAARADLLGRALLLLGSVVAGLAGQPAEGAVPRQLSEYRHVAWTSVEGAPANVTAIAQGDDGYLWVIAPTAGLFRFDGVAFEHFATKIVGMSSIVSDQAGGLWANATSGVVHIHRDGTSTSFLDKPGWPKSIKSLLVVDAQTIWLATASGMVLVKDGQPQKLDGSWNVPTRVTNMVLDGQGRVWAGTGSNEFFYLAKGSKHFVPLAKEGLFNEEMVAGPDDWIWLSSDNGVQRFRLRADRSVDLEWITHEPHGPMLFDSSGGFWSMAKDGLQHASRVSGLTLANADSTFRSETITPKDGLSADVVWTMFEDAEHNVWAGTSAGIDRFTPNLFHSMSLTARSLVPAIAPAAQGRVWVAHFDKSLMSTDGTTLEAMPGVGPQVTAVAVDQDRSLWVGDKEGRLWHIAQGDRPEEMPIERTDRLTIRSLAFDCEGSLWASVGDDWHLAKFKNGRWVDQAGLNGLPNPLLVRTFRCDTVGALWFIYKGNIHRLDATGFNQVPRAALRAPFILYQRPGGTRMWAAGNGLAFFDGKEFRDLKLANGKTLMAVTGVVETKDGDLWVHGNGEAIHVAQTELARAYTDPTASLRFDRYDTTDGLTGSSSWSAPLPTVTEGDDGRLWFATTAGLAWLDAPSARDALGVARVRTHAPIVDDIVYKEADSSIPALSKQYRFPYSAVGVANPERLHFQYLLDGLDQKWEDAGVRRIAYYNDLPPGDYRFRVATVNDDGSRGSEESAVPFRVMPAWYQTVLFRAVLVLVAIGILWLLYLYRLHYLIGKMETRQKAQQQERDRVSREIHDTLLQSVYGLMLRFQSVRDVTPDGPSREVIDAALRRADAVVAEGRDRVQNLRQRETKGRFADALRIACLNLGVCDNTPFQVFVKGEERELESVAQSEITSIFVQAVANAYQHANAKSIDLTISYSGDELQVALTDDGLGIASEVVAEGREGHWGLKSMKERAELIGATLLIASRREGGTSVELHLPGQRAYVRGRVLSSRLAAWFQPAKRLTTGLEAE